MAKTDWTVIGFRLPDCQIEMLDAFIEESDEYDSLQDYFHSRVLEDIEDVELNDPQTELEALRQQKRELRDDIEDVTDELDALRDRLGDLEERERELEQEVEATAAGAESYEAAVREAADELVAEEKRIIEKSTMVQQIANEWVEDPMDVLQDIYEADPRVRSTHVNSHKGKVPRDDWQYRTGEDRDEAVELVGRYIDARAESGVRPPHDDYIQQVADDHDVDVEELAREAVEGLDHEFDDVVFGF